MKATILAMLEGSAWLVALAAATAVRMSLADGQVAWRRMLALAAVAAATQACLGLAGWTIHRRLRRGNRADGVWHVVVAWAAAAAAIGIVDLSLAPRPVPLFALAAALPLALLLMFGARFTLHALDGFTLELLNQNTAPQAARPVVTDAELCGRPEVEERHTSGTAATDDQADPSEIDPFSIRTYVGGKRVLITGADRPIGAELAKLLARLDCGRLVLLDDANPEATLATIRETEPEVVFHVAGPGHIKRIGGADDDRVVDLIDMENVLLASVRAGTNVFLNVASSRTVDPGSLEASARAEAERLTTLMDEVADGTYASVRFAASDDEHATMSNLEAARLILQAGASAVPGKVMIIDSGNATTTTERSPERERRSGKPGIGPGNIERRRLRQEDQAVLDAYDRVKDRFGVPSAEPTNA